ncbi:DNA repair protein RecN [Roseivirga pacifica]|uniref:DNA repair protein RecN n=1 Tax=Roseivirga pacifica TaxID=1267423 RepID=UPI00209537E7|nr:DNA repair protein RecN [Roseivirga pacifica]MCO6357256.1 DNA repair protein RecN [Roseivirga pacifica]MCO6368030.1 DNA repair protein RecN [Roseivirga pacifica]MCO6369488.1 DNA repair protein RecN [Roseivirga pacifica]MCO6373342.1 DNA repair protein RecN [Roseivirga pacifica]MCO6377401.1 DNA repair protein RecN [Roseivirga pacifica]
MLQSLSIENYTLIKQLRISPNKQLNIITGETGAGKSIMLGALGLLLGNRAESRVVFDESKKCIIEGVFNISAYNLSELFEEYDIDYEVECIIRREVNAKGKSRAFVNDTPTTLEFLKVLGLRLMDIHSQHETLRLSTQTYQLEVIDILAGNAVQKSAYQTDFKAYLEKRKIHKDLIEEGGQISKEADYNQFLFDELDKAQLQTDEQEALEAELAKLEHAEEIKTKLNEALALADQSEFNIISMLHELKNALALIGSFGEEYNTLKERVESVQIELKDIVGELETEDGKVDVDPQRTLECQERLNLIYKLQQKHQVNSNKELIEIYEALGDKVLRVSNLDEAIEEAKKAEDAAYAKAQKSATILTKSRQSVFEQLTKQVSKLLASLGMPNASLTVDYKSAELSTSGADNIELLFSANKGIAPSNLAKAASGGEFSRLMFAIKYILADKTALPTIVFDEIDTGISGEIALKMAEMMQEMATNHQVITITHLPQIAAKCQAHYYVYKDESEATTSSQIKLLNQEERLTEIAQMIGGKQASSTAYDSARELMEG